MFEDFHHSLFPFSNYKVCGPYVKVYIPNKQLCSQYYQEYRDLFNIELSKRKRKSWFNILTNLIDEGQILYISCEYKNIETGVECKLTIHLNEGSFTVSSINNNKERAKGLCSKMAVERLYRSNEAERSET